MLFWICCVDLQWSRGQAWLHLGSPLQHLSGTSGAWRRGELCSVQPGWPGAAAVCQRWLHHQGLALAADGAPVAGHGPAVEAPQPSLILAESQQELCERKTVSSLRRRLLPELTAPSSVSRWHLWCGGVPPGHKTPQTVALWPGGIVNVIIVYGTDIPSRYPGDVLCF